MRHDAPFQEALVAREQETPLPQGRRGQGLVVGVGLVACVEPSHAQVGGETTEVHVENEAHLPKRLPADARQAGNVEGLEHRVDAHERTVGGRVLQGDGFPVHEDEVNLGVRHTEPLDDVAEGRPRRGVAVDGRATGGPRQKVIQLGVEAEADARHGGIGRRPALSRSLHRPPGVVEKPGPRTDY